jgi:hypothetical protein
MWQIEAHSAPDMRRENILDIYAKRGPTPDWLRR